MLLIRGRRSSVACRREVGAMPASSRRPESTRASEHGVVDPGLRRAGSSKGQGSSTASRQGSRRLGLRWTASRLDSKVRRLRAAIDWMRKRIGCPDQIPGCPGQNYVPIGEGSFGRVYQAIDRRTGHLVAIKELKRTCDPMATQMEVRALRILQHPNIVRLQEVGCHRNIDFFVFEYMECSLRDLIFARKSFPFTEAEIRSYSFQLLQGLNFMHQKRRFMHRDLKPANLLVNKGVIKIADLGTATEIDSNHPFHHYVTTRSYRAPEMLLRVFEKDHRRRPSVYDEKVDMWAVGAILAELFLMRPVFNGYNSAHQLYDICRVIGAPTWESWMGGMLAARFMNMPEFGPKNGVGFRALMPYASQSAINLIESLCSWDPVKRPSAAQALQHPFFHRVEKVEAPPGFSYCNRRMNYVIPKMTYVSTMQPVLGV